MPVAAPLIGGAATIAGAALSKPKTQTQADPNAYLQPYLQQAAQTAQTQMQQGGPQTWQGSTIADISGTTLNAMDNTLARAQQGSPLVDAAQGYVQNGLQQPISSEFGQSVNPFAASAGNNPYASSVQDGTQSSNPYASGQNMFGGASNPYLDATFNKALDSAVNGVQSRFASSGRNIAAGMPVAGDIASSLAAQIYAPAYENERNRQLQYQQQLTGIGATGFENQQGRQLQAGLAGQQIGANSYLAGQQIGAQGYENAQGRQLQDLTAQRQMQQNLLGYASPLAAQDYADLAAQQQVGQFQDQRAQAQLSDQVQQYNQTQAAPFNAFNTYLQQLQGLSGSGSAPAQQMQVQQPNYLSAGLGGALLGSQLFPQSDPGYGANAQQQQLQWLQSQQQPVSGLF